MIIRLVFGKELTAGIRQGIQLHVRISPLLILF